MSVIAHRHIFMTGVLESTSDNFNTYIPLMVASVDYLSFRSRDVPGFWYNECFLIVSWTFWVLCYEALDFIQILCFIWPPLTPLGTGGWGGGMKWCCLVTGRWGESQVPFDMWGGEGAALPLGRDGVCGAPWGSADVPLSGEGSSACLLQPVASSSMA